MIILPNGVKIIQTQPILVLPRGDFQLVEQRFFTVGHVAGHLHAQTAEIAHGVVKLGFGIYHCLQLRRDVELHRHRHRRAGLPTMLLHIIGHGCGHIAHIIPDVAVAVAIPIHRPLAVAGRHKLRHAHGAGIAAFKGEHVLLFFVRQLQELIQLFLEKFGAARIAESQGGERIAQAERAHIAAVVGFDAHNCHNQLRRHAIALRHRINHRHIIAPEAVAILNAAAANIVLAKLIPWPRCAGAIHNADDIGLLLYVAKKHLQFGARKAATRHALANKALHIRAGKQALANVLGIQMGLMGWHRRHRFGSCFSLHRGALAGGQQHGERQRGQMFFHGFASL